MPKSQCDVYFYSPYRDSDTKTTHWQNLPLLVFLPGLNETGQGLMSRQMASLKNKFDIRCLVIPPKDLDGWDVIAESTIALIEAELTQNNRPVYLCSESFGGCLALKMLSQTSNLFAKTILINPASSFYRVPWLNFGSYLFPLTPEWIYYQSAFFTLPFLTHVDKISPQACEDLADTIRCTSKHTAYKRIVMMRDFSIDESQLRQIQQPILLIGSREDLILPSVEEAERLARIFPQATVVTLPHSGHACLVEPDIDLYQIMQANNFVSQTELILNSY